MSAPDLTGVHLEVGKHESPDDGMCLLEAVAWFAGESHSDHPACVSPVLAENGRSLNDALPDDLRQRLVPLVPRMVGTAGDGLDETRGWLAADWLIRVHAPTWLDAAELSGEASALRGLAPVRDMESAVAARLVAVTARDAALHAAGDADTTTNAAWGATGGGALYAARAAAWIAGDVARTAAADASWYAAAAAWTAARAAASDALAPTVTTLQLSAIDLLDQMIDGRWAA